MKKNTMLSAFLFALFFTSFIFCPGRANSETEVTETQIDENTTWTASGSPYILKNSLTITESATLTLQPGTIVKTSKAITVDGTLSAQGTAASPVVFTSWVDDSYGGDTNNDGSATSPAAENWAGIKINATGGQSVLKHCIIQYGGSSSNYYSGIYVEGSDPTIEDCTIKENNIHGIRLQDASPNINHNTISYQDRGIYSAGNSNPIIYRNNISENYLRGIINWNQTITIDAENNYWGHPSGPYDPSDDTATGGLYNPGGLGDRVSDYVDYYPWLDYDPTDISDSDGDGIPDDRDAFPDDPDEWEDTDGDGTGNNADPDDDDDGFTDEEEIAAGTDPLDPNSFPNQPTTTITRVSVAFDGTEANLGSDHGYISADGRFVLFLSAANNLVPGGSNGYEHTFVHDLLTSTTEQVSVSSDGTEANQSSSIGIAISADGRFAAFHSSATNLVQNDTNSEWDIFVHDRLTGATERISVASDGTEANGKSQTGSMSADGRFVTFLSVASNLVQNDTNSERDIFVHDRLMGTTERVSVASDGTQANMGFSFAAMVPSISADGQFVTFHSAATNLVPGDTNGVEDIFVHDRLTGTTERVSIAFDGAEANDLSYLPRISAEGRFVAFYSIATNLVPGDTNGFADVFVHDRLTGNTERVSIASDGTEADHQSYSSSISADGRFVTFLSVATNLVPGDTNGVGDIFVHDRLTGTTERVSIAFDGAEANDSPNTPRISADGRFVAFSSFATNLVPGDTNGNRDIFVAPNPLYSGGIDSDGDGIPDDQDAFPDDPDEWEDTDGDGTGNNADPDDDDDGFTDEEEIAAGTDPLDPNSFPNQPPTTPALSSPANGATDIDPNNIILSWIPSTDPEGDAIEYCVTVNEDAEPDDIPVFTGCDDQIFISDTSFTLPISLEYGKTYWWAAWSRDDQGNWSEASEWWSFDTQSGPTVTISSISPIPVDGILPVGQGVTLTFTITNAPTDDEILFELKRRSVPDNQTEPDGVNWWRADVVIIDDIDWDNQTQSIRAVIPFCLAPGPDWRFWGEHVASGARAHSNETFNISEDLDSDGDALPDTWECHGVDYDPISQTVSACTDGDPDVDLQEAMGAKPTHQDIFVEIDWMEDATHIFLRPKTAALEDVITAFANAPIDNIDGSTGINLHIDRGQDRDANGNCNGWRCGGNTIPFEERTILGADPNDIEDWSLFRTQIKDVNFEENRKKIFHYCVFLNRFDNRGISGLGWTPGTEFIVALGRFGGGSRQEQAGTFMHEFGHNLGLQHGGGDRMNHKPNYLSVMNYAFQMTGLWKDENDGIMDYSQIALPYLSEACLNETVGLNGGAAIQGYGTKFYTDPGAADDYSGSNEHFESNADGPIDWNRDKDSDNSCVLRSINDPSSSDPDHPDAEDAEFQLLRGHNDWENLVYNGGGNLGVRTGEVIEIEPPHEEMTFDQIKKIQPYPPSETSINALPDAAVVEWKPSNLEIVSYYNIYRKTENTDFQLLGSTEDSFFEDHNLISCGILVYGVTSVDRYGNESEILETVEVDLPDTIAPVPDVAELPEVRGECSAAIASPPTATDNCAGTVTGTTSDPLSYSEQGTYTVAWTYTDISGNTTTQTQTVVVEDTTPPELSITADPDTLWPPNHKMKPVTVTADASDNCDANPDIVLVSVISNEPDDAPGGGDGHTINDIQDANIGTEDYNISLRAERSGGGDGRIYTITYEATDYAGNNTTAEATVTVPHNQ